MFYKWMLALALFLSGFQGAFAQKKFLSSYLSFDIQRDWQCREFGVNWICWHFTEANQPPALIINMAQGFKDTAITLGLLLTRLASFHYDHFDSSSLLQNEVSSINQNEWAVNAFGNKLNTKFFNRTAFTICCKESKKRFHIFVGFYAPGEHYASYYPEFLNALKTLSFETNLKKLIAQYKREQQAKHNQEMMSFIGNILTEPYRDPALLAYNQNKRLSLADGLILGWILLFFVLIVYVFLGKKIKQKAMRIRKLFARKRIKK